MSLRASGVVAACIVWAAASFGFADDPLTSVKPRKVSKTDAEWQKQLTREQYFVTRGKDTEAAFSGRYWNNHTRGYYLCVCCGTPLFTSNTKFDSGTGWPSFNAPIDKAKIDSAVDNKEGYPRMEVMCNDCGAHLGHVFDDGPAPTGLRYCINSASLKFLTEAQYKAAEAKKAKEEKAKADAEKQVKEKAKADAEKKANGEDPEPSKPATKTQG
jgi:peptide-methionine (R)-S-oxide reductase